jgi:hypothetical protein
MQTALRLKNVDPEKADAVYPNALQHIAFGRVGQTLIDLVQPSQIKIACPADRFRRGRQGLIVPYTDATALGFPLNRSSHRQASLSRFLWFSDCRYGFWT